MTGIVTLSGIIVLSNPRYIDETRGNKNLLLDADMWCDDNKHPDSPSVGLFHYFNTHNYPFEKTFTVGHAIINIAKMDAKVPEELRSEGMDFKDYAYIGDILQFIPLDESVQPDENPFIFMAGAVNNIDNDKHTFELDTNQYINITHENISFPTNCFFPDSPKYGADGSRKPKPAVGGFVAAGGFLKEVLRNNAEEVESFSIQVENIAFLGRTTGSAVAKRKGTGISSNRPVNKRRFDFNQDLKSQNEKTSGTAKSESTSAATTLSKPPVRGKGRAKD